MNNKKQENKKNQLSKEKKVELGEKTNYKKLLKDIEEIRRILLKNDPDRFKEDEKSKS